MCSNFKRGHRAEVFQVTKYRFCLNAVKLQQQTRQIRGMRKSRRNIFHFSHKTDQIMESLRLKYSSTHAKETLLMAQEGTESLPNPTHYFTDKNQSKETTGYRSSSLLLQRENNNFRKILDSTRDKEKTSNISSHHVGSNTNRSFQARTPIQSTVLGLKKMNSLLQQVKPHFLQLKLTQKSQSLHVKQSLSENNGLSSQSDFQSVFQKLDSPIKLIDSCEVENQQTGKRSSENNIKEKDSDRSEINNAIFRVDSILDNIRNVLFK